MTVKKGSKKVNQDFTYETFDQIDGQHQWQKEMPEGCINYGVRKIDGGQVTYFNFALAKEMGLIDSNHENKMNRGLENKILSTFSLRIINEFDINNENKFHKRKIKTHKYMATRYLQLQHPNKRGETSGDGRSIWNGQFQKSGVTWDVSSRGTGVTTLAPGTVISGQYLETGSTEYGYGCGLAEIDELYSSAIMAEIMHNNRYKTERMLAIIDYGDGTGIGVRAGKCLFRPAHLFCYLKQENSELLKTATDYIIQKNYKNGTWNFSSKSKDSYDKLLDQVCTDFAEFSAKLERDYIFAWMDWDGDNVLMNAGIIDYGSIRQFGLRHDQYRYDDVERFSTTLNEQKGKIKLIVKTFIQLVDYLKTGKKKAISHFNNHKVLKKFDKLNEEFLLTRFLYQIGLNNQQIQYIIKSKKKYATKLYSSFFTLESVKTKEKVKPVDDGVNRPAIFNMRQLLIELPIHLRKSNFRPMFAKDAFDIVIADSAEDEDRVLSPYHKKKFMEFQQDYIELLTKSFGTDFRKKKLTPIIKQSKFLNRANRVTGNGLVYIVDELLTQIKFGLNKREIQSLIDLFVDSQSPKRNPLAPARTSTKSQKILETFELLIEECKESI